MVLATTYLANIYTKIPPETISHFNEDLKRVFLQRTFVVQLQKNLEHFMFLDNRYDNLANTIVLDPPAQSSVGCKKRIEEGIRFGFTPESYEELKGDVQEKFIEDDTKELRYFTTEELFAYAANGFSPDSESSQQVGGLATMLAMMSQAIDKHRYPRHTSDRMARQNISIQKENIRDALNVSHNLLPLARTLDLQPAVRALQEVVADTFFPEQWKALQQSLEKQSGSYSHVQVRNGRKRSRLQKRDSGIYFDTQTSMNTRAVHEYVRQQLENIDVDALYVSAGEFEKRKFKKLQNKSDEPILAPNEYTVFEGKKGPGSIFDKWLNECRTKKLYSKRWYGNCRAGQEQTALRERFKDPKVWEEYIFGATDIIRCSVVFGQELAQIFTLPKGHPNEQNTFLAVVHLQYRDSPAEEKWDSDIINHVRSNRVNPDQKFQSVSERSEAEEFRIDPFFDIDGFLRFEYHQLLLLNPENKGIRNLQFEIHCLSEVQYWVNNFKEQLHILFKLKSSKKRRSLSCTHRGFISRN